MASSPEYQQQLNTGLARALTLTLGGKWTKGGL